MAQDEREIAELARELGVSAEHASRALGRSFGMPPRALRREARWRRALQLLGAPMALAEVAAAAGFADQSHLHRIVVAHAGCTPLQLRRELAQGASPASARPTGQGRTGSRRPDAGHIKCVQDSPAALAA
jgi:AraC-like DNA-binding protein